METHYNKIYTGSFVVVQLITTRLKEIGISPVIKDETESGRLAGFGSGVPGQQEIFVHEDEMDEAVKVVESTLAEMEA